MAGPNLTHANALAMENKLVRKLLGYKSILACDIVKRPNSEKKIGKTLNEVDQV